MAKDVSQLCYINLYMHVENLNTTGRKDEAYIGPFELKLEMLES